MSALIKFKLLNFAAVSYLSVPMILVNFSLFSSFGKVTLKLISSPFALPTLDITIPLFRPSSKNKLLELKLPFKSLVPMLVLPDSSDKKAFFVFPDAKVLLTSPGLNT